MLRLLRALIADSFIRYSHEPLTMRRLAVHSAHFVRDLLDITKNRGVCFEMVEIFLREFACEHPNGIQTLRRERNAANVNDELSSDAAKQKQRPGSSNSGSTSPVPMTPRRSNDGSSTLR